MSLSLCSKILKLFSECKVLRIGGLRPYGDKPTGKLNIRIDLCSSVSRLRKVKRRTGVLNWLRGELQIHPASYYRNYTFQPNFWTGDEDQTNGTEERNR